MLSLALFLIAPYATFVFISESINPFSKPHSPHSRFRWRVARRFGLVFFIGFGINLLLNKYFLWPLNNSLIVTAAILIPSTLIMIVVAFIQNRRRNQCLVELYSRFKSTLRFLTPLSNLQIPVVCKLKVCLRLDYYFHSISKQTKIAPARNNSTQALASSSLNEFQFL